MYIFVKRSMDIVLSLMGLIICLPFFFLIAFIIKVESRGPIIYRGVRTGKGGHNFIMYKFRTMIENAEITGGYVTAKNDERITTFGSFLRRYKLDELPQLINVLLGTMSLVGPRPEVEFYTKKYSQEEQIILSVKPGITDYSSIEFVQLSENVGTNANAERFQQNIENVLKKKNRLRVKYVNDRSFKTDFKILLRTITKLLKSSL